MRSSAVRASWHAAGAFWRPPTGAPSRIDVDRFEPANWSALEAAGAVAHFHLAYKDVLEKLHERGAARIVGGDRTADAEAPFLDLYVALLTPAGIGINILGRQWYDKYMYAAGRGVDDQILLIAANGRFSVLGADWEHADTIAPLELVQGEKTIRLSAKEIHTLPFLHTDGTPHLTERALVVASRRKPGSIPAVPGRSGCSSPAKPPTASPSSPILRCRTDCPIATC